MSKFQKYSIFSSIAFAVSGVALAVFELDIAAIVTGIIATSILSTSGFVAASGDK